MSSSPESRSRSQRPFGRPSPRACDAPTRADGIRQPGGCQPRSRPRRRADPPWRFVYQTLAAATMLWGNKPHSFARAGFVSYGSFRINRCPRRLDVRVTCRVAGSVRATRVPSEIDRPRGKVGRSRTIVGELQAAGRSHPAASCRRADVIAGRHARSFPGCGFVSRDGNRVFGGRPAGCRRRFALRGASQGRHGHSASRFYSR